MQKVKSDRTIDEALSKLISDELNPHTCQIFERNDKGAMYPYGSGVLAEINEKVLLLTAAHVTKDMSEDKQLYFRIHGGYVSIVGDLQETDLSQDKTIDLAYVILDNEVTIKLRTGYKFLPLSKFRRHTDLLDAVQYCVIGFPEKNMKIEDGRLRTGSSAYFVQPSKDKVYDYLKFSKEACYIFDFKGKGDSIHSGENVKINTDVHGISGCGVWLCILYQDGEKISTDYRLIGIMTEFRKGKFHCLIGNRIELLLNQLREVGIVKYIEKKIE
jgi:hypothetical protein